MCRECVSVPVLEKERQNKRICQRVCGCEFTFKDRLAHACARFSAECSRKPA